MQFVYKFEYHAKFDDKGSEHELCSVFVGQFDGVPDINTTEISAWRWIAADELSRELNDPKSLYTPWLRLEWTTLNQDYPAQIPLPR
jgi:isopentenyl-diphosphate delta-isomerase